MCHGESDAKRFIPFSSKANNSVLVERMYSLIGQKQPIVEK